MSNQELEYKIYLYSTNMITITSKFQNFLFCKNSRFILAGYTY